MNKSSTCVSLYLFRVNECVQIIVCVCESRWMEMCNTWLIQCLTLTVTRHLCGILGPRWGTACKHVFGTCKHTTTYPDTSCSNCLSPETKTDTILPPCSVQIHHSPLFECSSVMRTWSPCWLSLVLGVDLSGAGEQLVPAHHTLA